jgi:hypothetical protein
MKRWERWGLHLGAVTAGGTGLLYGALRYFGQTQGEFGPAPHPLQAPLQHLHVLLVPLLVFALGLAVRGHASGMLQHHVTRGRKSGLALLGLIVPMVFGGYAIQLAASSTAHSVWAWAHGLGSLAFAAAYTAHWLKRPEKQRRRLETARRAAA